MILQALVVGSLATNCYVVASKPGNAFVIDPGDEAKRIQKFLDERKLNARFIVNTHGHIDHIRADADLGLPVYVPRQDNEMIVDPGKNLMTTFFGGFEPVAASRLLEDGDVIELDELRFEVIHTPGHTRGGICLYGHGLLFSGDTLFRDGVGRTDFPGASAQLLEKSLERLARLSPETVVYPGHGPATTIGRELERGA